MEPTTALRQPIPPPGARYPYWSPSGDVAPDPRCPDPVQHLRLAIAWIHRRGSFRGKKGAPRWYQSDYAYDDMLAGAVLGLVEASVRFEASRGLRFTTYAWHWMRCGAQRWGAVWVFWPRKRKNGTTDRSGSHLLPPGQSEAAVSGLAADGEAMGQALERLAGTYQVERSQLEDDDFTAAVVRRLRCPRQKTIVRRMVLNGDRADDVGRDLGISAVLVRRIRRQALAVLEEHAPAVTGEVRRPTAPCPAPPGSLPPPGACRGR